MGSKILAGEGIEVITVNNGEAAVKKLAAGSFDLVLADIFMPGRSGYELCSYIKNSPKLALTPVVLIVGLLEPYDDDQGKSVGADAVLRKPFETTVVVETVRRLMEAAQQRRAAMAPPAHERTQILTAPAASPAPPATGAEEAVPEMQVAAPAAPAPVAIPPEMQDFAMELDEQPAELQTEPVPPLLELEHLVVEPESGSEHAILDLPPVAAEQPREAVVAPPVVSPAAQPIESAAPFDFAELQMTAAEAAEPVAFELPQEQAEAPDFEALPASPAEAGVAPSFIPPSGTAEQEGGSIDFTAQLQSMAAAAGAGTVPEAELSAAPAVAAPPVAAPPAQVEVEPAEAQGRPQWIIEPQPTAESDLGAFAEAATAPAIEAAAVAPSPAAETGAAAEVAAVEPEVFEETPLAAAPEPATLVEEAPPSLEAAAPEPAAPEAAILAEPAVPRETQEEGPPVPETAEEAAVREEADREVRAFETRPAAGVPTAESAPPTPTAREIDQAVAHAAEPPAAPHPAAAAVPDWAELLKTVEQTPGLEVRQPVEAAAEPAAPPSPSPAAAVLPAAELRAAIETGLNSALPGITAVPGLLDTIMREILRRFDSIQ